MPPADQHVAPRRRVARCAFCARQCLLLCRLNVSAWPDTSYDTVNITSPPLQISLIGGSFSFRVCTYESRPIGLSAPETITINVGGAAAFTVSAFGAVPAAAVSVALSAPPQLLVRPPTIAGGATADTQEIRALLLLLPGLYTLNLTAVTGDAQFAGCVVVPRTVRVRVVPRTQSFRFLRSSIDLGMRCRRAEPIAVRPQRLSVGVAGGAARSFVLTLPAPPTQPVSVQLTPPPGVVIAGANPIVFAANQTAATVAVAGGGAAPVVPARNITFGAAVSADALVSGAVVEQQVAVEVLPAGARALCSVVTA